MKSSQCTKVGKIFIPTSKLLICETHLLSNFDENHMLFTLKQTYIIGGGWGRNRGRVDGCYGDGVAPGLHFIVNCFVQSQDASSLVQRKFTYDGKRRSYCLHCVCVCIVFCGNRRSDKNKNYRGHFHW